MKTTVTNANDARQTPQWGAYLQAIGWEIKTIGKTQLFVRKLPIIKRSIIKIQHPFGPIPFKQIDSFAKKNQALFTIIEPHVYRYDEKSFQVNGYIPSKTHYAPTATIKIDLTRSKETLFRSFSENARRNIKKAQNNNLMIKKIEMKDTEMHPWFDDFYKLLENLVKMKRFYIPSYDEFYKKMTAFKKNSILLFAYEKNVHSLVSTPIAVVWYACFHEVIAYFQTGITQKGYDLLANYLLVWEGMKLARKFKVKVFDFEFVYDKRYPLENKKHKNYTEFKKRFHGEIIYYPPIFIKFYDKPIQWIYEIGSRFTIL